ncbi:hypothetical protein HDU96_009465 [Phlyctochytrium bullatum]|nr:hypothetical protein HDU96_009465 [Phlyctochytrium bullatum]
METESIREEKRDAVTLTACLYLQVQLMGLALLQAIPGFLLAWGAQVGITAFVKHGPFGTFSRGFDPALLAFFSIKLGWDVFNMAAFSFHVDGWFSLVRHLLLITPVEWPLQFLSALLLSQLPATIGRWIGVALWYLSSCSYNVCWLYMIVGGQGFSKYWKAGLSTEPPALKERSAKRFKEGLFHFDWQHREPFLKLVRESCPIAFGVFVQVMFVALAVQLSLDSLWASIGANFLLPTSQVLLVGMSESITNSNTEWFIRQYALMTMQFPLKIISERAMPRIMNFFSHRLKKRHAQTHPEPLSTANHEPSALPVYKAETAEGLPPAASKAGDDFEEFLAVEVGLGTYGEDAEGSVPRRESLAQYGTKKSVNFALVGNENVTRGRAAAAQGDRAASVATGTLAGDALVPDGKMWSTDLAVKGILVDGELFQQDNGEDDDDGVPSRSRSRSVGRYTSIRIAVASETDATGPPSDGTSRQRPTSGTRRRPSPDPRRSTSLNRRKSVSKQVETLRRGASAVVRKVSNVMHQAYSTGRNDVTLSNYMSTLSGLSCAISPNPFDGWRTSLAFSDGSKDPGVGAEGVWQAGWRDRLLLGCVFLVMQCLLETVWVFHEGLRGVPIGKMPVIWPIFYLNMAVKHFANCMAAYSATDSLILISYRN